MKYIAMCVALSLLGAGCVSTDSTPSQVKLENRLAAAEQIANRASRDQALHKIALDATDNETVDVAEQAVQQMSSSALRDNTAADCAKSFNGEHDDQTANELLGMINNTALRESLRRKFTGQSAQ